ncbi:hypothetical protein KUTeg_002277 [Tegillarca granosa]|uniref:Uncharacterized protein n=1 Tax=Tegillarca granosa TaxID=220873 RepID=A0ABQ9FTZ7_TEGGR|nr:hypothetical protein KUTeg_002277 [Tegillarca granosa]
MIEEAVPKSGRLPDGVSVVYDEISHVHALQFSSSASKVSFPSKQIFKNCNIFPEEFSVFLIIKHLKNFIRNECLLTLIDMDRTIFSIQLTKAHVILIYNNKKAIFRNFALKDNMWHSVGFSVTGRHVIMTTDCVNKRRKRLKRKFPSLIQLKNSTMHIASCKNKGIACPPRIPRHLHMDNRLPSLPDLYGRSSPGPRWEDCRWTDVGNIAYDLHSKTLKVCVNGIWQHATMNIQTAPVTKRLDYLDFHQEIQTLGPAIDIRLFQIENEGTFAAFANTRPKRRRKDVSGLYKWINKNFILYQKLETDAAQHFEYFRIQNHFFLAVANYGRNPVKQSNSTIYKWHKRKRKFKKYQTIPTWTARDIEHFEMQGNHYLAVANHAQGDRQEVDSVIYVWNEKLKLFQEHQKILTVGAYDWTYFYAEGYHFLAVAQAFNGISTLIDSRIYVSQNNKFYLFQTMETNGATDWEFFTIKNSVFLAVANAYNYGPQNFMNKQTYHTNSTIFKLNLKKRGFERFQTIPTDSAVDWEFFTLGTDSYLIQSNAQNGGNENQHFSYIYRWQGLDRFVPVHEMATLPNTDWEVFQDGQETYFVYSNPKGKVSQVMKATYITS